MSKQRVNGLQGKNNNNNKELFALLQFCFKSYAQYG